jgi:glycosyltransferase involved in cell wall biosynthesis
MARTLDLGGTERQMTQIALSLDRRRFEPHVGCFHADGLRGEELRAAGVPIVELPVRSFRGPSAVHGAVLLGRYLRRHGIPLVHTFDVPMNVFGVPAARFWSTPFVLSSQRAHRHLTPGPTRHLLRLTDRMVDAIVVNSESVARELTEEDRTPASLLRLCYNGIDTRVFRRQQCERPEPLRGASLVIGTLCALRPEKNLPMLLAAFARVRGKGIKLAIVGSGPEQPKLTEEACRLGIAGDCWFEPSTAEVPRWLSAMDVFVLPSDSEALSNSLMEAMACGCCAAASRVGGNPELIHHLETGLLFRAGDVDDLTACLTRLIADEELRTSLAAAGTARMHREFSLEASAARMAEIYESVSK